MNKIPKEAIKELEELKVTPAPWLTLADMLKYIEVYEQWKKKWEEQ